MCRKTVYRKNKCGKWILTEQRYETDGFALFGRLPGKSLRTVGSGKGEVESFVFSEIPEEMGMRYEGRGRVRTAGGTTEAQADGLVCKDVLELEMDPETGAQPKLRQMFLLE